MDEIKKVQDLPRQGKGSMHGDWRNHLKRVMDEIKKVQDLPKVRERRHAGTGGTTSRE